MILKFLSNLKKSINGLSLWFYLGSCLCWSNSGAKICNHIHIQLHITAIEPPELEVLSEIMVGKRLSLVFCSITLTEGDENKIYLGFHWAFRSIWLKLVACWQWLVKHLHLFALCLLNLFLKLFIFSVSP